MTVILLTAFNMKVTLLFLLLALIAGSQAMSVRQLFGACVEMCSGDGDCPAGQVCRSNGCGHTCQDPRPAKRVVCMMCALYCPCGSPMAANGCPACSCLPCGATSEPELHIVR